MSKCGVMCVARAKSSFPRHLVLEPENIPHDVLRDVWVRAGKPVAYVTGPKWNVLYTTMDGWLTMGGILVSMGYRPVSPGGMAVRMGIPRQAVHDRVWKSGTMPALYSMDERVDYVLVFMTEK